MRNHYLNINLGRMQFAPTRTCDCSAIDINRLFQRGPCLALTKARFGKPVAGSLGAIIGSFKSAAARSINQLFGTPGSKVWHRNYYEHIIRNEKELYKVRRYIRDNPMKWVIEDDISFDILFGRKS